MSASDPKRTSRVQCEMSAYGTQRSGAGFLAAEECAYDSQTCQSTCGGHCVRRVGKFGRSNGDGQGRWGRPWRWRPWRGGGKILWGGGGKPLWGCLWV